MSAVSLLSSSREKPTEENKNNDSNNESHEENGVSNCGDPAVLAVGPASRPLTYTREQLLHLRNSPLVKRNLENAFAGCDALALVLKKRPESPNEEDRVAKGDALNENHKIVYRERERRSADPRERVRKESETSGSGAGGIVLSPQRRSFTSGCGAPSATPAQPPHVARTRPDSPLSTPAATQTAQPKTEQVGRRIGSGRIMVRDVPTGGWEDPEYRAEPYRPPHRDRDRDHRTNGDRLERRTFSRDNYSDMKRDREDHYNNKPRDREDNRRSGGRYNQRRYDKEDEPEWFSGGPTSQLETIELRGFDEPTKKNISANTKDEKRSGGAQSPGERAERNDKAEKWRDTSSPVSNRTLSNTHTDTADTSNDKDSGVDSKTDELQNNDQPEFNLDEFLKFDSIPDVLTNGGSELETGSRFSRWFRRDSPTNDRHYERLLHNMVDDLDSSTCIEPAQPVQPVQAMSSEPTQHQHVFAPISPAGAPSRPMPQPPSLLDLLLRPNEIRPDTTSAGGKIHSLEELEARLRPHPPQTHNVPDHDLTAFKRLLAQVSGGQAVPAAGESGPRPHPHHQPAHAHAHAHAPQQPQPQPMSLLQMLSKSMEQQQKAQQQQQQQQQQHQQQQQQPPHIPQELLYKLLQVQQRQQQHQQPGVNEMGHVGPALPPIDRDLLQRPEAQAIVQGLKSGDINVQNLMQQLSNPGMQSRHREVLLSILRQHQQQKQMGGSPLPGSVGNASHLVVPPHHQPLRLSPVPHQGVPTRIPSPRELAVHTQSIMQGALIKKKLEEQRENYRRRHEMQQQQPKQPTPISFTPTSVLRKMTAEKESETPSSKQQQWSQPSKVPQGRPIVKGNQSGAAYQMGYSGPTPAEYQQHYLNQQQQMVSGVRPFTIPQQRQQVPNTFNNMNNMARGMPGGATLHQLLVQSHQRSLNEMSGVGGVAGSGGGDNQLARWFSPELLARASAGKLPSVHVPNALSLEDLERHHHSPAPPLRN